MTTNSTVNWWTYEIWFQIHKIESMPTNEIIFWFWWPFVRLTPANRFNHHYFASHAMKYQMNEKDQDTPWYNGIALKWIYLSTTNVSPSNDGIVQYSHYGLFSCSLCFVLGWHWLCFHIVRSLIIDQMIRDSRVRFQYPYWIPLPLLYSVAYRYKFWDIICFH